MRLDTYNSLSFNRGVSRSKEAVWIILEALLFSSWLPGSAWRIRLLRAFGARVGSGVVIKPRVRVKFPWRLIIGDHCWVGESAWFDNLADITLGDHVCISQGVYLCTGSHDWEDTAFRLFTKPINIGSQSWVAAFCRIAPGTTLEPGVVLSLGSRAHGHYSAWHIYLDQQKLKKRAKSWK